jgi:hypothetical protein
VFLAGGLSKKIKDQVIFPQSETRFLSQQTFHTESSGNRLELKIFSTVKKKSNFKT